MSNFRMSEIMEGLEMWEQDDSLITKINDKYTCAENAPDVVKKATKYLNDQQYASRKFSQLLRDAFDGEKLDDLFGV